MSLPQVVLLAEMLDPPRSSLAQGYLCPRALEEVSGSGRFPHPSLRQAPGKVGTSPFLTWSPLPTLPLDTQMSPASLPHRPKTQGHSPHSLSGYNARQAGRQHDHRPCICRMEQCPGQPQGCHCPLLTVHQEALQAREPGTVLECLPGLVLAFLHRVPTMSHSVNVTTRPEWGAVHQWPRGGCLTPDSTS